MINEDLGPPEDTRRNLLRDLATHVNLPHIYVAVIREQAVQFACIAHKSTSVKKDHTINPACGGQRESVVCRSMIV